MGPGDVVLLEMNGEKWAFINLKRGQCVSARYSDARTRHPRATPHRASPAPTPVEGTFSSPHVFLEILAHAIVSSARRRPG
jgi:hypothetical protein